MIPEKTKRWTRGVFIVVCSTVLCAVALEGVLRLLDFADPPAFESNPHFGYLMRPNQSTSTRGYRFHINNAGLRGNDFVVPKRAGVYRIAFLGDSITYGGGFVPDANLFTNRTAGLLHDASGSEVEAINISCPGWGIKNIASYVTEIGVFDADVVVWVVPSCDFRRQKASMGTPIGMRMPTEKPMIRLLYVLEQGARNLSTLVFEVLARHKPADRGAELLRQNLDTFRSILVNFTLHGIPAVVVFVPGEAGFQPFDDFIKYRETAASCSVPLLDTRAEFEHHPAEKLFVDGVHLNIRGHKVLSNAIASFLERAALVRTAHCEACGVAGSGSIQQRITGSSSR